MNMHDFGATERRCDAAEAGDGKGSEISRASRGTAERLFAAVETDSEASPQRTSVSNDRAHVFRPIFPEKKT